MKKLLLTLLFLFPSLSWAACTGSSPTWTTTPDYASVSSCVSQASAGDTINVSAGSATWTETSNPMLTITKGINLIGAGIDQTTITNGKSDVFLIKYDSTSNSEEFRISGFTFDMNSSATHCIILNAVSEPTSALVRIDNNKFQNSTHTDAIIYYGSPQVFGVVYKNIFNSIHYVFRANSDSQNTWDAYPDRTFHDSDKNFWVEDNVFNMPTTTSSAHYPQIEGDYGARWGLRYNTFYMDGLHWSFTDAHGGISGRACMGAIMYGNYIDNSQNDSVHIIHDRGAKQITHHNNVVGPDTNSARVKLSSLSCPSDWEQDMNNTYHFQNRQNTTGNLLPDYISREQCSIPENEKYWMDTYGADNENPQTVCINCDNITSGIGCGTDLPTSCTPSADTDKGSTAFWKTDQSCTDLTGLTGASTAVTGGNRSPSSTIEGTLYLCTATDTWTSYYTPFEYPHPLRGETSDTVIQNLTIKGGAVY